MNAPAPAEAGTGDRLGGSIEDQRTSRTADPARAQLAAHRLRDTARRLTAEERREIADVVDRLGVEVSTARVVLGASWALAYAAAFDDLDVDERLRAVS